MLTYEEEITTVEKRDFFDELLWSGPDKWAWRHDDDGKWDALSELRKDLQKLYDDCNRLCELMPHHRDSYHRQREIAIAELEPRAMEILPFLQEGRRYV